MINNLFFIIQSYIEDMLVVVHVLYDAIDILSLNYLLLGVENY